MAVATSQESIRQYWLEALSSQGYLASADLAFMVGMAVSLQRPLLLEGPAGSGKTFLASALAGYTGRRLKRLQCYEGIDASAALYDWNYAAQLVALRRDVHAEPFSEDFLLARPLLASLREPRGAVLLLDEVDRGDEGFEALLLEFLAEYQVTIPEWRTIAADTPPLVILTSNRSRPLGDALRRRCLYAWLPWPDFAREVAIVRQHVPQMPIGLVESLVQAVVCMRQWSLIKPPGLAETIDWARACQAVGFPDWDREWVLDSLGLVIKDRVDQEVAVDRVAQLTGEAP